MRIGVDVREATHVKYLGEWHKIHKFWGISKDRKLAKPSEGGFGVILKDGTRISMWESELYGKEENE